MKEDFGIIETGLKSEHRAVKHYVMGFILSIILTLSSYILVVERLLSYWPLISAIGGLAILQMIIQLFYFVHLDTESKPRWNLLSFLFMAMVVVLLVFGSLWIMISLDERVMPAANIDMSH